MEEEIAEKGEKKEEGWRRKGDKMETGVSSARRKVSKNVWRPAGASPVTESFIGDYCWWLMEADNTSTQAR